MTHHTPDGVDRVASGHASPDGLPDAVPDGPTREAGPDAPLRGVRALAGDEFSFSEAIGGVRGLIESTAPGLVFVVVYVVTRELTPALASSLAVAGVAVLARLVQRTPATQAFSGVIGVGVGAVWAWTTGEAQDYYTWGLWVNLAWALGALVSVLVRWPVVGVIVSLLRGHDMSWRTDRSPAGAHLRRRYAWATWLWVGVFGARLAVQVPLWLQGEDSVGWLGTAKLVMGVPLFAVGLWITWLLVGSRAAREEPADPPPTPQR